MDDTRTQQALDELADLFLSGQTPKSGTHDAPGTPYPRNELTGPTPIRLGPKLRTSRPAPVKPTPLKPSAPVIKKDEPPLRLHTEVEEDRGSPLASIGEAMETDDIEAGEAYFEQDDARDTQIEAPETDAVAEDAPKHAVAVEAVILGNLPGLSGPWLTQYAQLLAQQEGPVAILHVDDDLIDLELVEPTNQDTIGRGGSRGVSLRMPPGGGRVGPVNVLEALLSSTDSAPGTVLVHLDPQNDEHGLARALMIEDWTLMCGADDLAVVGGYRMLKTLVEKNKAVARKRVGLMIMGSDPKVSQDAASKFQSAAQSFLNTPVQLLGWQKQMVPVNLRHLGRFEDVGSAWPKLAEWFDRYAATEPMVVERPAAVGRPAPPPVPVPEPTIERIPVPTIEAAPRRTPPAPQQREPLRRPALEPPPFVPRHRQPEPTPVQAPVPQPVARETAPAPETAPQVPPATEPIAAPQTQTPRQAPVVREIPAQPAPPPAPAVAASAASGDTDEPNLVELLMSGNGSVPGGIAMEARCPHQPQTQLMLDQAGRLHLLHRHDSQTEGLDGLQPAMVDLMQARKWVREHLALLQLTQRQLKFDPSTEPVLHLFTDRADWATALNARLGEALKLHLLQEVRVGDQSAWFCTPLN
jgi:hypothetical protein